IAAYPPLKSTEGSGHRHDLPRPSRWLEVPVTRRLLWPNKFAIVRKRDASIVMPKLQSRHRSVLELGKVIRRETVPQRVVRPLSNASVATRRMERLKKGFLFWRHRPFVLPMR